MRSCIFNTDEIHLLTIPTEILSVVAAKDLSRVQTSVDQRSFAFHGLTVWNSLSISTAGQQSVTQHLSAAAEDSSVWTVISATWRRCDVSLRFWRRI